MSRLDRVDDFPLIGPELNPYSFFRQVFGQGSAPGSGTEDTYSADSLHEGGWLIESSETFFRRMVTRRLELFAILKAGGL